MEVQSPLAGIRVVEVTSIYSGPLAGLLLAELGADVIKVESPSKPDLIRNPGGVPHGVTPVSYAVNRGKRFVSIDATSSAGRTLIVGLAASADVLLHNIWPGIRDSSIQPSRVSGTTDPVRVGRSTTTSSRPGSAWSITSATPPPGRHR